ncbi:BTB/POZ domain-containing protein [Sesamum alatum]|uniref:BTB/POZ domain-containing protein n=1 Tax=Sesamum alatum TaxID=300844 RepID=A0AAE1YAA7_9LAMI|nr:BTB/POZ domain-containing protein [Sesamum alatum]
MELGVRGWNELGIVGTIYEEEDEHSSSSSSSSTLPSLEPTSPNQTQLKSWHDPDVVVHVHDSSFRLHKEALMARSAYLKRQLSEFPEITLSPPLNITAQTFSLVTDFCYGNHVAITPFNVAALRTAAELLGMTETGGAVGEENLQQKTEAYFRCAVAVNKEYASIVLRSCFPLLPEAETVAALVSRCIEALSVAAGGDGEVSCLDDVKSVAVEDLQVVLESTSQRLTDCHDLLYRIIDIYLKENSGKVSEDEKIQMCNYIDCSILTPKLLMHAVQNPRMPLRFVVQAMFVEQLNTRHSIISAADRRIHHHSQHDKHDAVTLGAILERDAALRQVAQIKAIMSATNSRIQTLEKELSGMRKVLSESESSIRNRIDSGRSASFRFSSETSNKIERGQIGSVSSLSYRDVSRKGRAEAFSSSEESSDGSPSVGKRFGQRLMSGLKSAFGLQKKKCERKGAMELEKSGEKLEGVCANEDIVIIKKDQAFDKRNR